ncbi:WG repeat-containing protein [Bradyrhizobium liaoningense]|uniref:WG repeat-containing protein n=1 Tax=Bradyrhizobium liaoningense TaxID=43992 RepID=UPI001BABCA7C|nr:WG repeat-containing protein [Bradyrhizobium liaoningense]MBR0719512.1 WG repeat-containing protein [Bradyrhizobium liaoningense]
MFWSGEPCGHGPAPASLRVTRKDGRRGIARRDGSWLIEPSFERIDALSDGLAQVKLNGKAGFIDRSGKVVITPYFDRVWAFTPGIGRTAAERDGTVGLIDRTGAWAVTTDYQQIYPAVEFTKDRTRAYGWHISRDGHWGLLDIDLHPLLDVAFDQPVGYCLDDRLSASKDKEWYTFKPDGSPLQPPGGRLLDAPCGGPQPLTLKLGDKFALVDADQRLVTPWFEAIVTAGLGIKNVKIDGKWGRIGSDGQWLIEPKYDVLSSGGSLLVAGLNGKRGILRRDGTWLIEPKFDAARLRDSDTAFVTVSGATGLLRLADQSWIIAPRPGTMCQIGSALMQQTERTRTVLSPDGETWIDVGAERIGTNLNDGLVTFLKDGKWGLVDTAGQIMLAPTYDAPMFFSPSLRGIAWAKRDGQWCAIDRRANPVPGLACTAEDPLGAPAPRYECTVEP